MSSKSRSLPLTELANLFGKSPQRKSDFFRQFVRPRKFLNSYNAGKSCCIEATAASGELFEGQPALRGEDLWRFLLNVKAAKSRRLLDAAFNWPVVSAVSDWSNRPNFRARHRPIEAVNLIGMQRSRLVADIIAIEDGKGSLVALDPRRTEMLTASGLLVVQSLIHHLLREQFPEFSELDIIVLQFPEVGEVLPSPVEFASAEPGKALWKRRCVPNRLGDTKAIEWESLKDDVAETLRIFREVLGSTTPPRPTGTGGMFPGFDLL